MAMSSLSTGETKEKKARVTVSTKMTLPAGSWVSLMDPLSFSNMVWKAAQRFGEISVEFHLKEKSRIALSMSDPHVSQVPTWEVRRLLRWLFA